MKLIDAIRNVDKSPANSAGVDDELLAEVLGMTQCTPVADFDTRVRSYWITKWYCTDTWVGFRALYVDGVPVGTIVQEARKSSQDFEFLSIEVAEQMRAGLYSSTLAVHVLDQDCEIYDTYAVFFGTDLLVKEGLFKGQPVTVVEKFHDVSRMHLIRIQDARQ